MTHELATSEEAMQGDETPFATTFGTSLALAPVQAHTGHFAIRREVVVPDDVADDSAMAGTGDSWLRDGLKLQGHSRLWFFPSTVCGSLSLSSIYYQTIHYNS